MKDARSLNGGNRFSPSTINFTLRDYNFGVDDSIINNTIGELGVALEEYIPYIDIKEYQPFLKFNYQDTMLNVAAAGEGAVTAIGAELTDSFIEKIFGKGKIKQAADVAKQAVVTSAVNITSRQAAERRYNTDLMKSIDDGKGQETIEKNPIDRYYKLLSGPIVATYKLPFYKDYFINTMGSISDWKRNSLAELAKASIQNTVALKAVFESFKLNYPLSPTWETNMEEQQPLDFEIVLYNNTLQNLIKNWVFINNISCGTYWLQHDYINMSSNIYEVMVPNRFHYILASMGVLVECNGKMRRLSEDQLVKFSTGIHNNGDKIVFNKNSFFPDSYKLTISIRSLIPNNFNTYLLGIKNKHDRQLESNPVGGFIADTAQIAAVAINTAKEVVSNDAVVNTAENIANPGAFRLPTNFGGF